MSDAINLVQQALAQSTAEVMIQAQVSLLRQAMDLQKETAEQILGLIGLGENLDVQA